MVDDTVYAQPTPENELTTSIRIEIEYLDRLPDEQFDKQVAEWVELDDPSASGERVFFSERLAARLYEATGRLIADAQRRRRSKKTGTQAADDLDAHIARLGRKRARAKRVRATVNERRNAASPRQQAYRILGELYPEDFRKIRGGLRGGIPAEQILAEIRADRDALKTGMHNE
jgi:hypothetical protein